MNDILLIALIFVSCALVALLALWGFCAAIVPVSINSISDCLHSEAGKKKKKKKKSYSSYVIPLALCFMAMSFSSCTVIASGSKGGRTNFIGSIAGDIENTYVNADGSIGVGSPGINNSRSTSTITAGIVGFQGIRSAEKVATKTIVEGAKTFRNTNNNATRVDLGNVANEGAKIQGENAVNLKGTPAAQARKSFSESPGMTTKKVWNIHRDPGEYVPPRK